MFSRSIWHWIGWVLLACHVTFGKGSSCTPHIGSTDDVTCPCCQQNLMDKLHRVKRECRMIGLTPPHLNDTIADLIEEGHRSSYHPFSLYLDERKGQLESPHTHYSASINLARTLALPQAIPEACTTFILHLHLRHREQMYASRYILYSIIVRFRVDSNTPKRFTLLRQYRILPKRESTHIRVLLRNVFVITDVFLEWSVGHPMPPFRLLTNYSREVVV